MEKVLKGRYEILKVVGLGGMSEVWLALDTQTRQTVAVKVLDKRLTRASSFARRFAQELAIARLLDHPGIPRLIDDEQMVTSSPLSFISEQLGAEVVWDNATRTITIMLQG